MFKFKYVNLLLFFIMSISSYPQTIIEEKIQIEPPPKQTDTLGWWIGDCYYEGYDNSHEIWIKFFPEIIEPGETAIMRLYTCESGFECDYIDTSSYILETNISVDPNYGSVDNIGPGTYEYTAPNEIPGDSFLVVSVNYENYEWGCAQKRNDNKLTCPCDPPIGIGWLTILKRYGSELLFIGYDSIDVTIEPSELYAGDTAQVIIRKRNPDGTFEDFPTEQTYEALMLDGCLLGKIVAGADTGAYVNNVTQPIYFIADTSVTDSGDVLLRVGLIEQSKNFKQTKIESPCYPGGISSTAFDDARASVEYPLKIIYPLSNTIQWITTEPQMPNNPCWAVYLKPYSGTIKYEWKFIVKKTYARRWGATCERISRCEFQGVSYPNQIFLTTWDVPFDKDSGYFYFKSLQPDKNKWDPLNHIYDCDGDTNDWYDSNDEIFTGGEVFITLTAKNYQTGEILATLEEVPSGKIIGLNPDPQSVYNYSNSNKIKAIIWKETDGTFKQFTGEGLPLKYWWPYNEEGWPLYGSPNGYGLSQLDNGPAATERQLWNWKANIDGGKQRLTNSYNDVVENHGAPNEDKYNWTNAFHSYNHGYKRVYYKWNGNTWIEKPFKDDYGKAVYEKYIEYGGKN